MVNKRSASASDRVINNTRGFFEWIVQRASALMIGAYTIGLFAFLLTHSPLHYPEWNNLMSCLWIRIATIVVVAAILWHAWIGLWTVMTDYVKCGYARVFLQVVIVVLLASYFVWCLDAFWG